MIAAAARRTGSPFFRGVWRLAEAEEAALPGLASEAQRRTLRGSRWVEQVKASAAAAQAGAASPKPVPLSELGDSFISGTSANYLEAIEAAHAEGSAHVDKSWSNFLDAVASGASPSELSEAQARFASDPEAKSAFRRAKSANMTVEDGVKSTKVLALVQAYENLGHRMADLDPLGLHKPKEEICLHPDFYGLDPEESLENLMLPITGKGMVSVPMHNKTVRQLVQDMREVYCGRIGYEFSHISSPDMRNWLQCQIETPSAYTSEDKRLMMERTVRSVMFEDFLNRKFPATKRFGLDGGWSLIPGMLSMIDTSADLGVEEISFAMAHR